MAQIPSARLANAQSRRCGLMEASWRWGVLLIVLTMAIHAAAVVTMAFAGLSLRARLETRSLNLWNLIAIQICVIGVPNVRSWGGPDKTGWRECREFCRPFFHGSPRRAVGTSKRPRRRPGPSQQGSWGGFQFIRFVERSASRDPSDATAETSSLEWPTLPLGSVPVGQSLAPAL